MRLKTKLTVEQVYKAAAKLRAMNAVPVDDFFVAIVHPNVACDLMLSDKWVEESTSKNMAGMTLGS